MGETDAWLPDLAPPPGGLARLRNEVRARCRRRRTGWLVGAAAACVGMMLVLILLPGTLQRYRARQELVDVVRQAVRPPESGGLRMIDGTAMALESGQDGVRLYLVQPVRTEAVASPR